MGSQAQTGSLKSTPKLTTVTSKNTDDVLFKNVGNGHNVPFRWASTTTVASGTTEITVASGTKFYDMDLASYATVTATPMSDVGSRFWVSKDVSANTIKVVIETALSDTNIDFDLQFSLGESIDVSELSTRGTGAPAQSYP